MKPFGWITTSAPSASALAQNGAKAGSDSSLPATLVRIWQPLKPSFLHRALELVRGFVAVLQRHGAERDEAVRLARYISRRCRR